MPQRECRSLWKVLVGISGDTIRGLLLRGKEHFSKTKMLSEESLWSSSCYKTLEVEGHVQMRDEAGKLMVWAWHIPLHTSYKIALLLVFDVTEKLNPFILPLRGKSAPQLLSCGLQSSRRPQPANLPLAAAVAPGNAHCPCDVHWCCRANSEPHCVTGCPGQRQRSQQLSSSCWGFVASSDLWSRKGPAGLLDIQVGVQSWWLEAFCFWSFHQENSVLLFGKIQDMCLLKNKSASVFVHPFFMYNIILKVLRDTCAS